MKFLIIFACTLATVIGFPGNEIKSRNIVVPAGRPEGRMTNAEIAVEGQFPYQAGLVKHYPGDRISWCGASLISHTEVITAAHCTEGAVKIEVYLGATNRYLPEVEHEVLAKDFIVHPKWNTLTLRNDIAIIKIPYTPYSANIQALKLPTKAKDYSSYTNETAVASGWGRISDSATSPSKELRYAYMPIIPNSVCRKEFTTLINPSNICASTYGHVSTCKGDSGDPLVLKDSKTLIGVTSFISRKGCEKNHPAAFTRITSYLDWIQENCSV